MKFIKLSLISLLTVTFVSFGMDEKVTLSSSDVLKNRFNEVGGLGHFVQKTGIDKELGSKEFTPLVATMQLEMKIADYIEYLEKGGMSEGQLEATSMMVYRLKSKMIYALLQDFPDALQELAENEIYEPVNG